MRQFCRLLFYYLFLSSFPSSLPAQSSVDSNMAVPSQSVESDWKLIAPDLEILEYTVQEGGIFASSLVFVRTALKNYKLRVGWAKEFGFSQGTVKSIAQAAGATLAINANFFDPKGDPIGLVVSRGISLNNIHRGGKVLTGIFQLTNKGAALVNRTAYDPKGVIEAVQAGPRLIVNKLPIDGLREGESASRRAGVCIDELGRILVFSSQSTFGGVTMNQLQRILREPSINCVDALNLDGGGSAQMYVGVKDRTNKLSRPGRIDSSGKGVIRDREIANYEN